MSRELAASNLKYNDTDEYYSFKSAMSGSVSSLYGIHIHIGYTTEGS